MKKRGNHEYQFGNSSNNDNECDLDAETILSPFLLKSSNIIHQNNCKKKNSLVLEENVKKTIRNKE